MVNELRIALGAMRVVTSFTRAADLVIPFYEKEAFEVVAAQAMMCACRRAFVRIHLGFVERFEKPHPRADDESGFSEDHFRGRDSALPSHDGW